MQKDAATWVLQGMDVSLWPLVMLEAELATPAIVDLDWWIIPLVPASPMEAGLDQNQFVIVRLTLNKFNNSS